MERPFRVPFYPFFPAVALTIATIALVAITIYNSWVAMIYFAILGLSYLWFHFFVEKNQKTL